MLEFLKVSFLFLHFSYHTWARSLVVSGLRSETKGSRFESGC